MLAWIEDTQEKLGDCECAPHVDAKQTGGLCFSKPVAKKTTEVLGHAEQAKAKTGCNSQHCLIDFLEKEGHIDGGVAAAEKENNLKPVGPANTTAWLNNHNINKTLVQWKNTFPDFRPVETAMMNFSEYPSALGRFDPVQEYQRGGRTFACVLNTDHHPGRGKHWVCMFGDMRGGAWTVEYFNSSGRPPPTRFVTWQVRQRNRLTALQQKTSQQGQGSVEDVVVNSRAHQMENSECGVYCLFYIWSRLNGIPFTNFQKERIPDKIMEDFRPKLFVPTEK